MDPAAALVSGGHAVATEEADDVSEELGGDGEVEQAIAAGAGLRVDVGEVLLEVLVAVVVVEVHGEVLDLVHEGLELGVVLIDAAALEDAVLHVGREGLGEVTPGDADDGELFGEQVLLLEVEEGGEQFALGEVARGAEEDDDAGVRDALAGGGCFGLRESVGRGAHSASAP